MFATACALRLRRREPSVFIEGRYEALRSDGPRASHVMAFARLHETTAVVVAVPRLISQLLPPGRHLPTGAEVWEGTRLILPPKSADSFRDIFTGARVRPDASGEYLCAAEVFRTCPVAILMSERGDS
jgi:(1->4)-alpha-D-glucan 1-alpha-D-glucosylmutase